MADELLQTEEKDFQRYYRFSSWWINHRGQVKALGYILFITLDAVLLCFAIWTFTDEFLITYNQQQAQVAAMAILDQADLNAQTVAQAAAPLQPGPVTLLANQGGTIDAEAPLKNPNADWWAEFDYTFNTGSTATTPQHGFILPGEDAKPILALATTQLTGAATADLTLQNIVWHRVDAHAVPDYPTWSAARLGFSIQNPTFTSTVPFAGKTIGQVTFTVTNATAYGYYNPTFDVLLERGDAIVGVDQTTLGMLAAGQTQAVTIDWVGPTPTVSQVVVVPDINLFDPTVYETPTSSLPPDIRDLANP